jgi:hypothetical protein
MEDCRPMSTPMVTNWKKLSASESELVDGRRYRQLVGSFMYLVNVIARFVGRVQGLESGLETGVTGASPPTVTSMGSSFYLGGQVQGRRP